LRPLNMILSAYQSGIQHLVWDILPSWFMGTIHGELCLVCHASGLDHASLAAALYRLGGHVPSPGRDPWAAWALKELTMERGEQPTTRAINRRWCEGVVPQALVEAFKELLPERKSLSNRAPQEFMALPLHTARKKARKVLLDEYSMSQDRDLRIRARRADTRKARREGVTRDDAGEQRPSSVVDHETVPLCSRFETPEQAMLAKALLIDLTTALTARELEIWVLDCNGYSRQEIATQLKINRNTVDKHLASARDKAEKLWAS